jgi:hypothetical protein
MGKLHPLVRAFTGADLKAEVHDTAFVRSVRGGVPVFQMDIRNKNRQDYFRIFPAEAETFVQNADKNLGQVVLFCQEPERKFTERRYVGKHEDRPLAGLGPRSRIIARDGSYAWIERTTPAEKRHFLMGHDERPVEYFIAQLSRGVSTVKQAHELLKAPEVKGYKGKVVRQGEWFFLEVTKEEGAAIERELKSKLANYGRTSNIAPAYFGGVVGSRVFGGNPHMADEVIVIPKRLVDVAEVVTGVGKPWERHDGPFPSSNRNLSGGVVRDPREMRVTFIRGKVRHPEHDTVEFKQWVKVVRNTEQVDSRGLAAMHGVGWVD